MKENFDIIIIGAGPAGSYCALALRNYGYQVALIDKSIFPRHKTCGMRFLEILSKHLTTLTLK
ncbi:FAD-dependent oxidoreductase [Salibacteraceae bacterium]|nr:FAD-dependent oxidoreductase [Salibacteraceae bacterium]